MELSALQKRRSNRVLSAAVALLLIAPLAHAEGVPPPECGKLRVAGRHGPFDYRTATESERELVEANHFQAEYRSFLIGNDTNRVSTASGTPASGFSYTLHAFPNHYLALAAMDRITQRTGQEKPPGAERTTRCYFERAVAYVPSDPLVRALYVAFLARRGQIEAAQVHVAVAVEHGSQDPNVLIQISSAYMHVKRYDEARDYAKKAYELGYPLYGIRDQLIKLGKWE